MLVIPKHLLKLSLIIIFGAFVIMTYIVTTDSQFFEENDAQEKMKEITNFNIHPLYTFLQARMDNY